MAERGPRTVRLTASGGVTLAADLSGDPSRPAVVLMHGGGQTRHAWGGTAHALAESGWYVVNLDLRGHGDSAWAADGDYRMDAFVADLEAVSTTLSTRPVLVGASLGGLVALLAEGGSSTGVARALVLVDVAPRLEPEGVARIVEFMTGHPDGFATLDEAADAVAGYQPHRRRPADVSGLAKNLRQGADGRWRWHWDPRFVAGEYRPTTAANEAALVEAAHRVQVPVLLVRGRMSDVVSEEAVAAFRQAVPHAETVDVSGAGHMVAGDRNDAFTAAVVDFLARLSAET